MEGEKISHVKQVLLKFLGFFKTNMSDALINIITFDTENKLFKDVNKLDSKQIEDIVTGIKAGGGTYFSGILLAMANFIRNQKFLEDLTVIFMTDGELQDKRDKDKIISY